jgi:spermidine synthase
MPPSARRILFVFFFLSGFSSLVYQVVWTRLAFASFGIIAPVLSIVLSVFMLGLAVGSWAGGRLIGPLSKRTGLSAIYFYGLAEGVIGLGAFAVPALFLHSEQLLTSAGQLNSFSYLLESGLALAISIFPWCVCMGVTFPFMMGYVRQQDQKAAHSFSFLYVANVLGAMSGTILTAVLLIEMLGFRHTLWVAALSNFLITLGSVALGVTSQKAKSDSPADAEFSAPLVNLTRPKTPFIRTILFSTGFISMALEVVWSRGFVGVLKTQVYSFAMIIFTYLAATFIGSLLYRRDVGAKRIRSSGVIFFWLAVGALLPVFLDDPSVTVQHFRDIRINTPSAFWLLASIVPFCGLLGYLTPSLIDEYSAGQPELAGSAYAINVLGCILGPLVGCYLLLPSVSARYGQILLGLPFIYFWIAAPRKRYVFRRVVGSALLTAMLAYAILVSRDFEEAATGPGHNSEIRRDYIASVLAEDHPPEGKRLVVNGVGMTSLTPITKCIADVPLALHQGKPKSILVICFGMGTTFKTSLCWGVDTTVVELVPSVPKEFGFYHPDAAKYLQDPNGHIIIDDGRRYLSRCGRKFDVITVDPPPPVEAAGCSLLYSREFYELAIKHLNPHGILQMWYMGSDPTTDRAVVRSMYNSFPYMRIFGSVEHWGFHMVGSEEPIVLPEVQELVDRLPPAAKTDLIEWTPDNTPLGMLTTIFSNEIDVRKSLEGPTETEVTDDGPFNEYYLIRAINSSN